MRDFFRFFVRWLTVKYQPRADERSFLERAQRQSQSELDITVAVLSDHESKRVFGTALARRGMQPVWIEVCNHTAKPVWLDLFSVDPAYYTPLEAACLCHFSLGKRLLSFGALAWLFLPLLPLIPFKILGARRANRRMDEFFKAQGYHAGPIKAGSTKSGFILTVLDEGQKNLDVKVITLDEIHEFLFSLPVPGLSLGATDEEPVPLASLTPVDAPAFENWLQQQPATTTNLRGTANGDPLNLVVVGDLATVLTCFGARWDRAETITLATCWKTTKAFLFDSDYRYSPVSPLYITGRMQELALQKVRSSINERIHLRLWRTTLAFEQQPVWIGQVSRDIGVRFTPKTWNLTTHRIDPDVDEARDYVINYLIASRHVEHAGFVGGVGEVSATAPRRNLTGDPYFTDGTRAVVVLSKNRTRVSFFQWVPDKRG